MQTKIDSAIWDDIGELDAPTKVAVFWLLTSRVNSLGYVEINERIFAFEAGVPISTIEGACKVLASGFVRTPGGVFLRNFIRRQFGSGPALERSHMCKTLVKHLHGVPAEVVTLVLKEYPELKKHHQRSLQAPAKVEGEREGEREGEGEGERIGGAGGKEPLTLTAAHAHAKRWCARSPAMVAYDPSQVELWHADRSRKSWETSAGHIIANSTQAQKDLEFWLLKHKAGHTPSPPRREGTWKPGFEKKETGAGAAAHPLAAPPCAEWRELARAVAVKFECQDLAWVDTANWQDLASEDRQAILDEFNARQAGRSATA